ncbi:hypothetical protein KAU34_01255 [candidate division WOR-3 bacterium]|nr:hypothetical protein [candidate division WOR-3 bacterium]
MKPNMKFGIGAVLAAMLLMSMAFAGAADSSKDFPKDSPVCVLMGLNDSQLQYMEIPDFGPEVFEDMKKDPKVRDTRGKIPRFETEKERRDWLDKLDENRIYVRDEMRPYLYPEGPVIAYGWYIEGYFEVVFYENTTVETSQIDEIYAVIDKQAKKMAIQDVPVAFKTDDFVQLQVSGYDNRYRPIIGGIQVQTIKSGSTYVATLGFAVKKKSDGAKGYVVAKHFGNSVGLQMWQPTVSDSNKVGTVSELGGHYADASFVPYSDVEAKIHIGDSIVGSVGGSKEPEKAMRVHKSGRSTGLTSGWVVGIGETVTQSGYTYFDQVKANYTAAGGDSGAPVYCLDGVCKIVGIHWGHTDLYSYFSPVSGVENDLGVIPLTR